MPVVVVVVWLLSRHWLWLMGPVNCAHNVQARAAIIKPPASQPTGQPLRWLVVPSQPGRKLPYGDLLSVRLLLLLLLLWQAHALIHFTDIHVCDIHQYKWSQMRRKSKNGIGAKQTFRDGRKERDRLARLADSQLTINYHSLLCYTISHQNPFHFISFYSLLFSSLLNSIHVVVRLQQAATNYYD